MNHKNWHPIHNLPQTCGRSESVCLVWIWPTEHFLTRLRTSFSINKLLSNRYDSHKSTINRKRIEQKTWWIFYSKKINQLKWKILNTQLLPLPQTYINLWKKQICISGLGTANTKFSSTPEGRFQYQWTLIRSMWTNMSTIKNANMITKNPKNNTWLIINWINNNNLYRLNCSLSNQE